MSSDNGLNLVPLLGPPTKITALVALACVLEALLIGTRRLILIEIEGNKDRGKDWLCEDVDRV